MHGVKDVLGAATSTALLYACATPHTLATFVPSLHLSFTSGFRPAVPAPLAASVSPFQENQQLRDVRSTRFPSPAHNPTPRDTNVPVPHISYWVIVSFRCGTPQALRCYQLRGA